MKLSRGCEALTYHASFIVAMNQSERTGVDPGSG
jgi:hypothetical protein